MSCCPTRPLRLLADLTPLSPGGINGGIKPLLRELFGSLGRQRRVPVEIVYLTSSPAHAEVRALARAGADELVCVRDTGTGTRPTGDERGPRERFWPDPPADLAARLGADLLFCPLGEATFHCPGVPMVATVVDVLHQDYPGTLRPEENAHRERLLRELLRVADRFQCISDHTRDRLHHHYAVPAERMFRTYPAVRRNPSPPGSNQGGKPAGPFFFYPANSWIHKNHEVLLVAHGIYRQESLKQPGAPPWPLVLTGHADARTAELRAVAGALEPGVGGEAAPVRFLGHVDDRRLEELWRSAGALVFSSLHEGFGIPLVEAMAYDVPILCGTGGAWLEVAGDACLPVDVRRPRELAAAMSRLAADGDLRAELVRRGRVRRERFQPGPEAERFLEVLLAQRDQPARPTSRGWWPEDGWTSPTALFGPLVLPAQAAGGRGRVRLRLRAMPVPRRVRLREGDRPLGAWDLAPGVPHELTVMVRGGRGPLVVEVPDAAPLSAGDPRMLGVWVERLTLGWAAGSRERRTTLLPATPPDPALPA